MKAIITLIFSISSLFSFAFNLNVRGVFVDYDQMDSLAKSSMVVYINVTDLTGNFSDSTNIDSTGSFSINIEIDNSNTYGIISINYLNIDSVNKKLDDSYVNLTNAHIQLLNTPYFTVVTLLDSPLTMDTTSLQHKIFHKIQYQ